MSDTHAHDGHEHGDPHAPIEEGGTPDRFLVLEQAIRELLIEKGVLTADAIRRQMESTDARTPARGAQVAARAWVDADFRAWLLADAKAAVESMGFDISPGPGLAVVENTDRRHHMVVCTLCSCYPRKLLGIPPAWYKSRAYRSRAVNDPRGVLQEFGTELPQTTEIRVVDSTADLRYMVLPLRPRGTKGWNEAQLSTLVTRDALIGVTLAREPGS
ncbi:MAG: nitrile hydratase subunit alpha [Alphaproteobacteria bacterium]|nr:nitrile hydratase subunit alpha [Alphaproteobacteria bacterium]